MIDQFLNKKFSTRNLSNEEFIEILPLMAVELSEFNYLPHYSDLELNDDWNKLLNWMCDKNFINSTSRIGVKLCEHFFPNFYDIKNTKGLSFKDLWNNSKFLEKVIIWNRKSHSTPYISELKRGVYFCGGLPKSTMYRPQMAKIITQKQNRVLDPCAGWGGRMLGSVASGCHYIAFEPNTETYNNLQKLVHFLGIQNYVTLYCDDALNMSKYDFGNVDVVLTSPPYFNLEIYTDELTQSIANCSTYKLWEQNFLFPLIEMCTSRLNPNGKSCWNVANFKNYNMWDSVFNAHSNVNYTKTNEYSVISSARQVNQKKKILDTTICFQKN